MRVRSWFVALIMCVAATGVAFAQAQNGVISGTVKDSQGLALPGVTVTLEGNGPSRMFITEGDGAYRFLAVPPGSYKVSAILTGFQSSIRDGIIVVHKGGIVPAGTRA